MQGNDILPASGDGGRAGGAPVADRMDSVRNARSNYHAYLTVAGLAAAIGVLMVVVDRSGRESDDWFVFRTFYPLAITLAGYPWARTLREAKKGAKEADDMTATHFRLQHRTFLIYCLYAFIIGLTVGISGLAATETEAAVASGYVVFA